jgi:hypothetical protein
MENIRNIIRKILLEAFKDDHYIERLYDRFLDQSELIVGYEIPGSIGQYEEVGTYILPENIKQQILANARLVEGYNFPKGKSYGIQIGVISIDKNKVDYISDEAKEMSKKHTLLFIDRKTQSNGNLVYAIVRENRIITVYFAKNYVPQDAAKLKVDGIIKSMDAIRERRIRQ